MKKRGLGVLSTVLIVVGVTLVLSLVWFSNNQSENIDELEIDLSSPEAFDLEKKKNLVFEINNNLLSKTKWLDRIKRPRDKIEREMFELAELRKKLMLEIMEDPQLFKDLAFSDDERKLMPKAVQFLIEEEVVKTGIFKITYFDDIENQISETHYTFYENG